VESGSRVGFRNGRKGLFSEIAESRTDSGQAQLGCEQPRDLLASQRSRLSVFAAIRGKVRSEPMTPDGPPVSDESPRFEARPTLFCSKRGVVPQ